MGTHWGSLEEEVLESLPVDAGTHQVGPPAVFPSGSLAREARWAGDQASVLGRAWQG